MLASTDIITQIYVDVDDFVKVAKPRFNKLMLSLRRNQEEKQTIQAI